MSLLGTAVVAIWNDIQPGGEENFREWHDREHIPERLSITGFLRGRRFLAESGASEYFTLYEAADADVLVGDEYLARLNSPTTWTRRSTAQFLNTQRGVCQIVWKHGYGEGAWLFTLRFNAVQEHAHALRTHLLTALAELPPMTGITGVSLCIADHQASSKQTAESEGRQVGVPNWIIMIEGISRSTVEAAAKKLADGGIEAAGAADIEAGSFRVEFSLRS